MALLISFAIAIEITKMMPRMILEILMVVVRHLGDVMALYLCWCVIGNDSRGHEESEIGNLDQSSCVQ